MLDLKYIKDNLEEVKKNVNNRFVTANPDLVVELYDRRKSHLQALEELKQRRNEVASLMKSKIPQEEKVSYIEEGKTLKQKISEKEVEFEQITAELNAEAALIPNMAHPDAPVGKEDKDNTELKKCGTIREFNFKPKDHAQLGVDLDIIDFDTATRISGSKFYYLKNEAVFLELALVRYAFDVITKHGFIPTITPDIANTDIVDGVGYNPRGAGTNIYSLANIDKCLIGTAEITLGGYHYDQILDAAELPIKMSGLSHCFRQEAGAAGQYSKGLYRVHQFTKVEMFIICEPQDSDKMHDQLLAIEEEIFSGLDVPYRVVDTCTGDLGSPAYRKFDLEAWMPGRGDNGEWGEITSTSNCTDYQARRLRVRYKKGGENNFVHMLNGTAIAISRALIAIIENFQREDGSVAVPEKLIPYTGFSEIKAKKF